MPRDPGTRRECDVCGIHTFNTFCVDCDGNLVPVVSTPGDRSPSDVPVKHVP